jgi:asparagine synthase (glutamine-hydrolysing)
VSGIFGLVHLDHSPVREEDLGAMRSAMQEWGRDGGGMWRADSAGLGGLITFDTPEALHEKMPLQSSHGFVLVAEARLDNRDELYASLEIPAADRAALPDGELLLLAYEKWGRDAPQHLLGDWSFAAWHPREQQLFLARDHFGNTGLYFYQDERRFAFASSRKALFALGIPRRLNEFFLACVLVSWSAHYGTQTIELDLHRLPPAHTLTLSGSRRTMEQYWWLEHTPELRLKNSQEYVEGLLSIYERAVRDRLRSTAGIGISLSGGLDSGSTAVLAARALRQRDQRLRAYTAVPEHDVGFATGDHTIGDEWSFAQLTAAAAGNVDLVPIPALEVTPIQGIKATLAIHDEPGHAASNVFWIRDLLSSARRDGLSTLLTGQGGNATVSWNGLDRARAVKELLGARSWKRAAQILVYPHLPLVLLRGLRHVLHPRGLDWSRSAISTDFARDIGLSAQYIQHSGDATKVEEWYPPRRHRFAVIRPGASTIGSVWAETSAAHGLDVRDATYDKRVMVFALSIPDREYTGPDGTDRWVLRAAMKGLLPEEVRLNRRLGMQAADVGQRLVASAGEVDRTLVDLEGSELVRKYIDVARLRRVWEALKLNIGPHTTHATITILTRGMMTGLHLLDREKGN